MTLLARRIALQGIGSSALAVAVQGFVPDADVAVELVKRINGGGGVIGSATISLSEWLRKIKKRAEEELAAASPPIPQSVAADASASPLVQKVQAGIARPRAPVAADPSASSLALRKRRRRAEEELLLLLS